MARALEGNDYPTFSGEVDERVLRRERLGRRLILSAVALFVLAGVGGLLGVRPARATATSGGYELTVFYAAITRAGLATPWSFEVRRPGGFDGPVVVATSQSYFQLFDENGLDPDPSAATTRGEFLVWEFDPPEGDTLSVLFDARAGPSIQGGGPATTQVLVGGSPVVEVDYRTFVVP